MNNRNWNQDERNRKHDGQIKCRAYAKSSDEYCTYEGIITAAITMLSIFSGLLIQLLIYRIFDVRIQDVPIILVIVLWVGFSGIVTHILNSFDL